MAIVRNLGVVQHDSNLFSVIALFCGVMCTVLMFRKFKASLNLSSGKKGKEQYYAIQEISINGAYRSNKEEYFAHNHINNSITPQKIDPSMVKLPTTSHRSQVIKPSKSTSDLSKQDSIPVNVRKSTGDILAIQQTEQDKKLKNKDRKKMEKQELMDQKKKEKLETQLKAKEENIMKKKEKRETKQQLTTKTKKEKGKAPPVPPPQLSYQPIQYSSNTLESSISRNSGPPPYSVIPETKITQNRNDITDNMSFSKPVEGPSSWDMVSQHREQLSKPLTTKGISKSTVLDLGYNNTISLTSPMERENSEA